MYLEVQSSVGMFAFVSVCVSACVWSSEAVERWSVESHNSLRQRQWWEITDALDGWKAGAPIKQEEEMKLIDEGLGKVSGV